MEGITPVIGEYGALAKVFTDNIPINQHAYWHGIAIVTYV
jgi:hypothetical protein